MDSRCGAPRLSQDQDYVVERDPRENGEMAIVIVDEYTGREMDGRQWSDGLHQAVEAKHKDGVQIKQETQTLATITLQNFFKLYKELAGMTGTAKTEAEEFSKIYRLDVVAIPTNRPVVRANHRDRVYRTEREKWDAIIDEIKEMHDWPAGAGRHEDVEKSEKLSRLLKRSGVKHEVLNAKPENVGREAEIVAQAGRSAPSRSPRTWPAAAPTSSSAATPRLSPGPAQELKDPTTGRATRRARSAQRRLDEDHPGDRDQGEDEGGGPQGRRDGRAAHRRHRTARLAAHRQPAPRPRRPPGRPGFVAASTCRCKTT